MPKVCKLTQAESGHIVLLQKLSVRDVRYVPLLNVIRKLDQFVHVGLAHDDGAGCAQALHDGRVLGRAEALQGWGAGRVGQARHVDVVLDGDGHAAQRRGGLAALAPRGVIGAGLGQRAVAVDGDEGVERGMGVDAVQAGLSQRQAGDAAFVDRSWTARAPAAGPCWRSKASAGS